MKFESELISPTTPNVRRVVIELPEDRAKALATVIDEQIVWSETNAEDELEALHAALGGWQ